MPEKIEIPSIKLSISKPKDGHSSCFIEYVSMEHSSYILRLLLTVTHMWWVFSSIRLSWFLWKNSNDINKHKGNIALRIWLDKPRHPTGKCCADIVGKLFSKYFDINIKGSRMVVDSQNNIVPYPHVSEDNKGYCAVYGIKLTEVYKKKLERIVSSSVFDKICYYGIPIAVGISTVISIILLMKVG